MQGPIKTTLIASFIVSLVFATVAQPRPHQNVDLVYRFAIGDEKTPVSSGNIWLYTLAWGYLEKFNLGIIKNGQARIRLSMNIIQPKQTSPAPEAYVIVIELPQNQWYRTADIEPRIFFRNFSKILNTLGKAKVYSSDGTLLVLPTLIRRRIIFQSENGKPMSGMDVHVSIYLYDRNHCGRHTGLPIGKFRTNAKGEIEFKAPLVPLYLDELEYYRKINESELGPKYEAVVGLKIGSKPKVLVREVWNLPEKRFEIRVQNADGTPVVGALVSQKLRSYECGAWSGIIGKTDNKGVARLQFAPGETELLTLVKGRQRRELSDEELKKLFSIGQINLKW